MRLKGGLGNQLFQYALGRRLSLMHDAELLFDTSYLANRMPVQRFTFRDFALGHFPIAGQIATSDDVPLYPAHKPISAVAQKAIHYLKIRTKGFSYGAEKSFLYDAKVLKNQVRKLYMNGYWQSYRYFDDIEAVIRQDLLLPELKRPLAEPWSDELNTERSVCVHVRRADYLQSGYHHVLDKSYIYDAVNEIIRRIKSPSFFIFSDDLAWCKAHIRLPYPTVFVDDVLAPDTTLTHFALMRQCRHFIIANSTFSWWAAWLSAIDPDQVVITPRRWFSALIDTNDLIPEGWIRV